jgi:6-phosphogluconolactonase
VFVYPFDRRTHRILTDPAGKERHVTLPPGSGPRHFAFHPRGRFLYLVSELTAQVLVFAWDAGAGRLTLLESLSTNAPDHRGDSSASEILASADGRFLYVGNRGDNSLVVYAIDARSGRLSLVQRIGAGGETPWSFAFAAKGRWLLVGNLKSDRISVFGVDRRTGRLSDSGRSAAAPKPTSFSVYP